MKKISRLGALLLVFIMAMSIVSTTAFAAGGADVDNANKIVEHGVAGPSRWLAYGPLYQYPAEGGTWEYGFWNVKVRSYYTVNKNHGSTVTLGEKESRSIDTASGRTSIAELWAVQTPGGDDHYYYRICK